MESWIDRHLGKIILFCALTFLFQCGIWAWRQPSQFRSAIVPKINEQIRQYNKIVEKIEKSNQRINMLMAVEKHEQMKRW